MVVVVAGYLARGGAARTVSGPAGEVRKTSILQKRVYSRRGTAGPAGTSAELPAAEGGEGALVLPPPSSAVVNTQGRESRGSGFETCTGVWYPRRRPRRVAINTLVDLIKLAGGSPGFRRRPPSRPVGTEESPAAAARGAAFVLLGAVIRVGGGMGGSLGSGPSVGRLR